MPLESATQINQLIASNPPNTDQVSQGDDHIRMIKQCLLNTLANLCGPEFPTSTGSANTQAVQYSNAPIAYRAGMTIAFMPGFANTGPATINVNSIGAVQILQVAQALKGNELTPGVPVLAIYDGVQFEIISNSYFQTGVIFRSVIDNGMQVDTPQGVGAHYYALSAGVRAWYWGVNGTNGSWELVDGSAPASRFWIDIAGNATIAQSLIVDGNETVVGNVLGGTLLSNGPVYVNYPAIADFLIARGGGIRYINFANNWALEWIEGNGTLQWVANGIAQWYVDGSGNVHAGANISAGAGISAGGNMSCADGVAYNAHGGHVIGFSNSGTTLTFYALGGSSGSWPFNSSDERLKKNINKSIGDHLAELCSLKLISYDLPFPDAPTKHFDCGISAQDLQEKIPDAITDGPEYLVVDTIPLISRLVGAVQQLTKRVEELERKAYA